LVYGGFIWVFVLVKLFVFNHFWVIPGYTGFLGPGRGWRMSKGLVLLDAEQALTLSLYQIVKERMAGCEVNLLII
jgi:hypothetical protein